MRFFPRLIAIVCFAAVSIASLHLTADELPPSPSPTLHWQDLAPIPNPTGLGGPLVGTHGDALLVAGGANFPDAPPWEVDGKPAGKKVWHTAIYLLEKPDGEWKQAGELPYPLAYAPVVSTDEGIYILGGETFGTNEGDAEPTNHPTAEVLRLEFNADGKQVSVIRNALPPLLKPCRYHAATIADRVIYIVAGHASVDGQRLGSKTFWQLDLKLPAKQRKWERRIPPPGEPREKMSLVSQFDADGKLGIYLLGGSRWVNNAKGKPDLANFRYFDDAYRYDIGTGKWSRNQTAKIPNISSSVPPRRTAGTLAAAPTAAIGNRYILMFSGDTGEFIELPNQDRDLFRRAVLCYDTHTNRWSRLADMPLGVVTTSAVRWGERIVIVSGEIRPGVRTDRVQSATVVRQ